MNEGEANVEFRRKTVALLMVGSMLVGGVVTSAVMMTPWGKESFVQTNGKNSTPYQAKMDEAYRLIKERYVRDVADDKLIDGALKGMVQALGDPYSDYMNQAEAKEFLQELDSSFSGIGAEVTIKNGRLTVVSPIKGSPAERAGIRPDDQILRVDETSMEGLSVKEAVAKIRGPKGSKVAVEILRPGVSAVQKISVVRDEIPLVTVHGKMLPDQVGYVQVTQFSKDTADEFLKSIASLEKEGMKGLVIDVRGNPGGLLPAVQQMAEQLVPGKKAILQVEAKDGSKKKFTSKVSEGKPYPIAMLINKGSASASEILAGALKESAGVPLVGETTFGKGTVQTAIDLADASNLKITVAKWLTPNGNWVDQHGGTKGIKPDIEVKPPAYTAAAPINAETPWKKDSNDLQVKNAQLMLDALGFAPGRTDGYFDSKTETSVTAFQKANSLSATGVVDKNTAEKLLNKFREHLQDPKQDAQLQVAVQTVKKNMK
ncbi:S41 family peptidase [Croceifilum oryzae]|uniref:S41 family peptidase n=1 Tax=Croceifilum oryzae TaxID=1553429 RepID=UPI003F9C6B5E